MNMKFLGAVVLVALFCTTPLYAYTVEADLAGWKVYRSTDKTFTQDELIKTIPLEEADIDETGKVTYYDSPENHACYYYGISAYDLSGNESEISIMSDPVMFIKIQGLEVITIP